MHETRQNVLLIVSVTPFGPKWESPMQLDKLIPFVSGMLEQMRDQRMKQLVDGGTEESMIAVVPAGAVPDANGAA